MPVYIFYLSEQFVYEYMFLVITLSLTTSEMLTCILNIILHAGDRVVFQVPLQYTTVAITPIKVSHVVYSHTTTTAIRYFLVGNIHKLTKSDNLAVCLSKNCLIFRCFTR